MEPGCIGSWIQTYTGRKFDPLNPLPQDVCLKDIAAALSKICRFTGHVNRFYSVATHCINASYLVPMEDAREALLHDASEAYLADLARPIKANFPAYKEIERKIEIAIALHFNLRYPWPKSVKHADNVLLRKEAEQLFPFPPLDNWHLSLPVEGRHIWITSQFPDEAEEEFLERWKELNG